QQRAKHRLHQPRVEGLASGTVRSNEGISHQFLFRVLACLPSHTEMSQLAFYENKYPVL
ncbi:hypothetical protein A2U01_0116433, partial [Trifolium medium]|nr:hypothetical protein [Trifolium medium]